MRFCPSSALSINATLASFARASWNDFSEFESPSIHSTSKLSGISSITEILESTTIFSCWFLWLISSKQRLMKTRLSELIKMWPSIPISSIPITSMACSSRSPFGLSAGGSICMIKQFFGISNTASGFIITTSFITTASGIIPCFFFFFLMSSSQVPPMWAGSGSLDAMTCPCEPLITSLIHSGAPWEWKANSINGT